MLIYRVVNAALFLNVSTAQGCALHILPVMDT
jgi:hypothetical protein